MPSRHVALLLAIVAVTALSACGQSCTADARVSVLVTVVDSTEKMVTDAKVTYRVDGGPEKEADCSKGWYPSMCDRWSAGWEEPGTFLIVATSSDGSKRAEQTVVVKRDQCHVQTELVMLTLQ